MVPIPHKTTVNSNKSSFLYQTLALCAKMTRDIIFFKKECIMFNVELSTLCSRLQKFRAETIHLDFIGNPRKSVFPYVPTPSLKIALRMNEGYLKLNSPSSLFQNMSGCCHSFRRSWGVVPPQTRWSPRTHVVRTPWT